MDDEVECARVVASLERVMKQIDDRVSAEMAPGANEHSEFQKGLMFAKQQLVEEVNTVMKFYGISEMQLNGVWIK